MKYAKVILNGILATAVMTVFMLIAPLAGLPDMNVGVLLGAFMGNSAIAGWILHFMMGTFFAFLYAFLFNEILPVVNHSLRGMVYGIIVFVLSEAVLLVINLAGFFTWEMKEDMALMIAGNMLACFVYGLTLGSLMREFQLDNHLGFERKAYFRKRVKDA